MTGGKEPAATVCALEAERARAIVGADVATLRALTAETYVHIDAGGRRRNRAEFLNGLDPRCGRFHSYDLLETEVTVHGSVAVVLGVFQNAFEAPDGRVTSRRARHQRVWVRSGEGWRNLTHQATAIPS